MGEPRHDFAVFTMTVTVPVHSSREPAGERDYVIGVIARAKPVTPRVDLFAR